MPILFGNGPINQTFPNPTIVAQRAPGDGDMYDIGQFWIDVPNNDLYTLTSFANGLPNWEATAGGAGVFASLEVDPGPTNITGTTNINADVASASVTTIGNDTAGGTVFIASAGIVNVSSDNMVLDATQVNIDVTTALTLGSDATIATVDMVNITPSVARTTTINGGAVITAVADTLNLATGGINTDAGASKVVNIASGDNLLGTTSINIGSGNATTGTHDINIGTGTGGATKRVDIGNADALTAITALGLIGINPTNAGQTFIGNAASGGAVVINSTVSSGFTVTGATQDLTLQSSGGSVKVIATEADSDAIKLDATTGGIVVGAAGLIALTSSASDATINAVDIILTGSAAAANAIRLNTSNLAGGIDIDAGTGGIAVDTTGALSLAAAAASNFSVSGAGVDLTLSSSAGSVVVSGGEAVSDAVAITAPAGAVSISGGAAATLGNVGLVNQAQAAAAGPSATVTVVNNSRIGSITFTGYTQAAAATLILTLTNSFISATSPIIASVQNAGANDAQMQITRILQGSGTADITITNQGAAALNGDMVLSYIVLA